MGYEGLWWVMRGYGYGVMRGYGGYEEVMVGYEGLWWVMRGYGGL